MRKKSKTFTGCWTCRARRVKCDEAQPICNRCTKAGRICEGYGVRLTWQGNQKETPFRVLIDVDTEGTEIPSDDLDDMINKCCYTEASHETQTFGPFSCSALDRRLSLGPRNHVTWTQRKAKKIRDSWEKQQPITHIRPPPVTG